MTITNNVVAKLSVAFVTVAMLFTMVAPAQAQSASELQAMIDTLLKQVAALQAQAGGSTSASCTFTRSLTTGSQGADVTCLQNYLISGGYSIPAGATGYFGAQTVAAVSAWQAANGVSPAAGYFGPVSQAKFAAMGGGSTGGNNNGGSTGGDLEGNAGSITVDDSSEFSGEEVGEGEEDVEVMEFKVEADDESDVEITSIKVEFVQGTSADSEDLTDYAESVSVWFGGEMVGEADADEFSESSDVYTKTISLDDSIVRAGEEEDFVIAVTALNNLDSGDIDTDSWTVDVVSVRFVDGDGVTTTEDTDSDTLEKTFDFTDFASAADVELKTSLGDDEINDGRVIDIDSSDTTDEVELISFMLEAEGDSDITINDLPVSVVSSADLNDTANTFYLFADGEEVASESTPSTATTTTLVTFEDVDFTIEAGEEVEFIVKADIKSTAGTLNDGDTIQVIFGETQTDNAAMDAEDETGETLEDGDMTGTASADAHGLYAAGMMVTLVDTSAVKNDTASTTAAESGIFKITFDVTAFDSDVYVDKTAPSESGTVNSGGADETDLIALASSTVVATISSDSGATEGTDGFLVEEGETERFTVTVNSTATTDAFQSFALGNIVYALTDADATSAYTFNLGDFKTEQLYLNN